MSADDERLSTACQLRAKSKQKWPEHVTKRLQTLVAGPQNWLSKNETEHVIWKGTYILIIKIYGTGYLNKN